MMLRFKTVMLVCHVGAQLLMAWTLSDLRQVYQRVHQLNPGTIFLVIFSGVVSAGYNFIQYTVVQTLSVTWQPEVVESPDGFLISENMTKG